MLLFGELQLMQISLICQTSRCNLKTGGLGARLCEKSLISEDALKAYFC